MPVDLIFLTQFLLSLVVLSLLANWYLAPALAALSDRSAIAILLVPHAFRHVGLVFLVPGVVAPEMFSDFAAGAGYGDLAAGLLALSAMLALRAGLFGALALTWLFSAVGLFDLANALRQAEVIPYFNAAWYIPTFVVPLLLVSHVMILRRLIGAAGLARAATPTA